MIQCGVLSSFFTFCAGAVPAAHLNSYNVTCTHVHGGDDGRAAIQRVFMCTALPILVLVLVELARSAQRPSTKCTAQSRGACRA